MVLGLMLLLVDMLCDGSRRKLLGISTLEHQLSLTVILGSPHRLFKARRL